jgi:ABC-type multidrug transport system ATPase subunit
MYSPSINHFHRLCTLSPGHNGAGKSTTISILTGMTEASEGDCVIYGHTLSKHLSSIRQITGICPQQNVLYPALTVQEHLRLIGSIKGLAYSALKEQVINIGFMYTYVYVYMYVCM